MEHEANYDSLKIRVNIRKDTNYMYKQVLFIVCLIFLPSNVWGLVNISESYPDPELKANKVVSLQLLAMQQNDESDHGIEVTFRFASPQNKLQTGPLSNFIMLVKNISYSPLLNHLNANYLELKIEGNKAVQEVIITTSKGYRKGFRFLLSIQQGKKFKNCWMTDAVIPFEINEA